MVFAPKRQLGLGVQAAGFALAAGAIAAELSRGPGQLLAADRVPFLRAVMGTDTSHAAAWGLLRP